jgi:hypothetical protein
MKICKELEQQFNLVPLKKGEREFEYPKAVNYQDGDLKHKAGNTVKFVLANFYFQSFGEYKTMLEHFNLSAEEVKGLHNGILYSATDEKGNRIGRPFKSSLFGKEAGYEALQKHYENSKIAIEKEKIRETLCPVITKTMREAKNEDKFRKFLSEQQIGVIFRTNEQGRIYGVTFMDYQNRAVLNGSHLGKEFSANVFNELFNGQSQHSNDSKLNIINEKTNQSDSSLGSAFGLSGVPQSGEDYEEENFIREHRKKKRKRKGDGEFRIIPCSLLSSSLQTPFYPTGRRSCKQNSEHRTVCNKFSVRACEKANCRRCDNAVRYDGLHEAVGTSPDYPMVFRLCRKHRWYG